MSDFILQNVPGGSTPATNTQSGTSYTVLTSDLAKTIIFTNSAGTGVAVSLAQAGTTFPNGWWATFINEATSAVTLTIATSTVFGVSKVIAPRGASFTLTSDGVNYHLSDVDVSAVATGMGGFGGGVGEGFEMAPASAAVAWNGATLGTGALGINVKSMILRTAQLCGHCSITNSGVVASSKVFTGLYDSAGNLLIDVAGATAFDGSIATLQTKTFTQVLLLPGYYYYAFGIGTSGSNTNTSSTGFTNTAIPNAQQIANGTRYAKATNAWSASTGLPTTLGVLTSIAASSIPCAFFEP